MRQWGSNETCGFWCWCWPEAGPHTYSSTAYSNHVQVTNTSKLSVLCLSVITSVAHQIMSPILAPASCCSASAACAKDQEARISTERQYKASYDKGIALLHHLNTHINSSMSRGIGTTDYRLDNYTIIRYCCMCTSTALELFVCIPNVSSKTKCSNNSSTTVRALLIVAVGQDNSTIWQHRTRGRVEVT